MYLLSACFSFVQGWLMSGVSQRLCYDLRRQISEKINRLPLAYFEKRTVGEVLSRITNDVDTLGQEFEPECHHPDHQHHHHDRRG